MNAFSSRYKSNQYDDHLIAIAEELHRQLSEDGDPDELKDELKKVADFLTYLRTRRVWTYHPEDHPEDYDGG